MDFGRKFEQLVSQVEQLEGDIYTTRPCPFCLYLRRHPMVVRMEDSKLRFECPDGTSKAIVDREGHIEVEVGELWQDYKDRFVDQMKEFVLQTKVFSFQEVLNTTKKILDQEIGRAKLRRKIKVISRDWFTCLGDYISARVAYNELEANIFIDLRAYSKGVAVIIHGDWSTSSRVYVGTRNFEKKLRDKIRTVVHGIKTRFVDILEEEQKKVEIARELTKKIGLEFSPTSSYYAYEAFLPTTPKLRVVVYYNDKAGVYDFGVEVYKSWEANPEDVQELLKEVASILKSTFTP